MMKIEKKKSKYNVGEKLPAKHAEYIKILAFIDNYYMVRHKGFTPFVLNEKELETYLKQKKE